MTSGLDPGTLESIVPLAVVLAAVGAAFAGVRALAARRMRPLLEAFDPGTARLAGLLQLRAEGTVRGYRCRYLLVPRSNSSPGGAMAGLRVGTVPCRFQARRPRGLDLLLAPLGLVRRVEVGVPELERRVRFFTREPVTLRSLLGGGPVRSALQRLVSGRGFHSLNVRERWVKVTWAPRERGVDEDPAVARERLEAAAGVLAALGAPPTFEG